MLAASALSLGAQDSTARRLPPVTVTVTRESARSPLDLPYAVSQIVPDSLRPGQTHLALDQALLGVPGLTLANRTNPSQDPRLSIRGFGARSAFGVRSVRVLRDGMPLTLPDGQTPVDYLDLESVGQIETLRGAAASLYGNASGGVIDIRSAPPPATPVDVGLRSWFGAFDTRRLVATAAGESGPTGYQANIGRTESDNYRRYSRQRLTNGFARLATRQRGTDLSLVALGLDMPTAENPGALTRAQFDRDPRLPDSASVRKRARKAVRQLQLGLTARHPLGDAGEVSALVYVGTRELFNPLTFAVVDVGRSQGGVGLSATLPLGTRQRWTVGVDAASQNDLRRNWANCNAVPTATAACPQLPSEKGALQLDQREIVRSIGPYLRDELRIGDRVRASAGIRGDEIRFEVQDRFLADGRDDSGRRTLRAVSPMAGLVARIGTAGALYANVGTAFETPTTTELGNHPDGSAGLNTDLQPQRSTTYETGAKGWLGSRVQVDAALFDTEVRDELIAYEVPGGNGRTYYRNAGRTRRLGAETSLTAIAGAFDATLAYTFSHFRFRDFASATLDASGNRIPGIPEQQLQASITAHGGPFFAVVDAQAKSTVEIDDANSARAPGFVVCNLRIGANDLPGRIRIAPTLSVQNVFDRPYVASVAINAAGTATTGKFYEPGSGRVFLIGARAAIAR